MRSLSLEISHLLAFRSVDIHAVAVVHGEAELLVQHGEVMHDRELPTNAASGLRMQRTPATVISVGILNAGTRGVTMVNSSCNSPLNAVLRLCIGL